MTVGVVVRQPPAEGGVAETVVLFDEATGRQVSRTVRQVSLGGAVYGDGQEPRYAAQLVDEHVPCPGAVR